MGRIQAILLVIIEIVIAVAILQSQEWFTGQILFLSQAVVGLSLIAFQIKFKPGREEKKPSRAGRLLVLGLFIVILTPIFLLATDWQPRSTWLAVSHSLLGDQGDITILLAVVISTVSTLIALALQRSDYAD